MQEGRRQEEVNPAWLRAPDDAMWRLQLVMLEHAARMARTMARLQIGVTSGLHPSGLIYQGDLGGRGVGKQPPGRKA